MPAIIESLLKDHRNIQSLLSILELELAAFERAERPDFDVLTAIVDYFRTYPPQFHHPKEDLIAARLAVRAPDRARAMIDIEAEHGQVGRRIAQLAKLVNEIMEDQEIPREALRSAADEFIRHERRHMEIEEQQLFPAALASLSDTDWAELDAKLADDRDPLFRPEGEARYAALIKRVEQWAKNDRIERATGSSA